MKTLAALIVLLVLASCENYPVNIGVEGNHGTYSYNPQQGFTVAIKATK